MNTSLIFRKETDDDSLIVRNFHDNDEVSVSVEILNFYCKVFRNDIADCEPQSCYLSAGTGVIWELFEISRREIRMQAIQETTTASAELQHQIRANK